MEFHEFGELAPDERFNLLIRDERFAGRIASLSSVRMKESIYDPGAGAKGESTFVREMSVFFHGPLSEDDLRYGKDLWEKTNGERNFEYFPETDYFIEVITDSELDKQAIGELTRAYGLKEIF